MSKLNLDTGAKFFLAALQHRAGTIDREAEAKIDAACAKKGGALSTAELQKVLTGAIPEHKSIIRDVAKACASSSYHADGCKADFLTQQIGFRIEKERAEAFRPPRRGQMNLRWTRDPLYARFVMDNEAQSIALFNGRDIDENGQPLLMKVVLRVTDPEDEERVAEEKAAFIKKMGGFEAFRTKWAEPDIEVVARDAIEVKTKDIQENEFEFGDPLVHVSFDGKGNELSRGVSVDPENERITRQFFANARGEPDLNRPVPNRQPRTDRGSNLDETPPQVFEHRIQLAMRAKDDALEGGWLDELKGSDVEVDLNVQPGLFFEPGKQASIQFEGASVETRVPADDAFFLGSASGTERVDEQHVAGRSLRSLLQRPVHYDVRASEAGPEDRLSKRIPAVALVYAKAEAIEIGGRAFEPLADRGVLRNDLEAAKIGVSMSPSVCEDGAQGATLHLKLDEGFLSSAEGTSIEGWKVVAGFAGEGGEWRQAEPIEVTDRHASGGATLELPVDDLPERMKSHTQLELRVFNEHGVPAQRLQVPFNAIPWADRVLP